MELARKQTVILLVLIVLVQEPQTALDVVDMLICSRVTLPRVPVNVLPDSITMVLLVRLSIVNHVMLPARHALVLVPRHVLLAS